MKKLIELKKGSTKISIPAEHASKWEAKGFKKVDPATVPAVNVPPKP
jgi:hypothetical protein